MIIKLDIGDVVQLKKEHPCGEDKWEILRTGVDIKAKCIGCGRQVMIPRREFIKKIKKLVEKDNRD